MRPVGSSSEPVSRNAGAPRPVGTSQNNARSRRGRHDSYPDIAFLDGPGRDRGMGGVIVSAEIIPFVPRPNRKREPMHLPPAPFRWAPRPDDLTMDHADTTP